MDVWDVYIVGTHGRNPEGMSSTSLPHRRRRGAPGMARIACVMGYGSGLALHLTEVKRQRPQARRERESLPWTSMVAGWGFAGARYGRRRAQAALLSGGGVEDHCDHGRFVPTNEARYAPDRFGGRTLKTALCVWWSEWKDEVEERRVYGP